MLDHTSQGSAVIHENDLLLLDAPVVLNHHEISQ